MNSIFIVRLPALALLLGMVFLAAPLSAADDSVLVVVVNPKNSRDNISAKELRQIFLGQKTTWEDGSPVVPLNFPASASERTLFDAIILRMSSEQVDTFWMDQKIRGVAKAPPEVPSSILLQRVVAQTPGGIAYVRAKQLTGIAKVVAVDGTRPEVPAYVFAK